MALDNSFNLCILMEDTYCIGVLVIIHTVQTYVAGSVLLNIDSTLTSPRTNLPRVLKGSCSVRRPKKGWSLEIFYSKAITHFSKNLFSF